MSKAGQGVAFSFFLSGFIRLRSLCRRYAKGPFRLQSSAAPESVGGECRVPGFLEGLREIVVVGRVPLYAQHVAAQRGGGEAVTARPVALARGLHEDLERQWCRCINKYLFMMGRGVDQR